MLHAIGRTDTKFEAEGPAGLMDRPRGGPEGSRLPDLTRRAILMLKETNPDWGCQRISDVLLRGPARAASPSAVARVLHEAGYELGRKKGTPGTEKGDTVQCATRGCRYCCLALLSNDETCRSAGSILPG